MTGSRPRPVPGRPVPGRPVSGRPAGDPADPAEPMAGVAAAAVVVGAAAIGVLSAVIEVLLVPLYIGTVPVGLAVLLAVVGNVWVPRQVFALLGRPLAAAVPVILWVLVVLAMSVSLPGTGGDVLLPGNGVNGLEYVTYGLLFGGILAGVVTVAMAGIRTAAAQPR